MNDEIQELYQDLILDHFKHPRCHGCLENPDVQIDVNNPLCGDQVSLSFKIEHDKIIDLGFSGKGCSISQASASMMAEALKGKSFAEAQYFLDNFKAFLQSGELDSQFKDKAGDLLALEGVKKFAARTRCALLAWEALRQGLNKVTAANVLASQKAE